MFRRSLVVGLLLAVLLLATTPLQAQDIEEIPNPMAAHTVFIILIVGIIVVAAAGITEVAFHPHPMLHLALWIPATIILSLLLLRPWARSMPRPWSSMTMLSSLVSRTTSTRVSPVLACRATLVRAS